MKELKRAIKHELHENGEYTGTINGDKLHLLMSDENECEVTVNDGEVFCTTSFYEVEYVIEELMEGNEL